MVLDLCTSLWSIEMFVNGILVFLSTINIHYVLQNPDPLNGPRSVYQSVEYRDVC